MIKLTHSFIVIEKSSGDIKFSLSLYEDYDGPGKIPGYRAVSFDYRNTPGQADVVVSGIRGKIKSTECHDNPQGAFKEVLNGQEAKFDDADETKAFLEKYGGWEKDTITVYWFRSFF